MQQNGTPGSTLLNNRYRLLAVIAGGGMATVYKAQDTLLNRIVAIKMPRDRASIGDARNAEFERQFREEATSAANLNHPNIVSVYDVGKDVVNGVERQYLVMEFVEGQDLKQGIRNAWATNQPFGVDEAVSIARQICEGVAFAHRRGLVHCDLKPQNVLLTPDGRVKVTDFGIARAFTSSLPEKAEVVWGTPQYYAPEQAQGNPPTPASDVYSIGVMLFEMLTGRLPFEGKNATELARQHMMTPPPAVSALNPNVSLQLENIVNRALSKDPAARYRDADQFAKILAAYLAQGEEKTLGSSAPVQPVSASQFQPAPPLTGASAAQPRAQTAQPPVVAKPSPRAANTGANTATNATSASDAQKNAAGPDLMLWVLGAIAILCVLGLVALYAVVYGRMTRQPGAASNTPAPVAVATNTLAPGVTPPKITVTAPATPTLTPVPLVALPLDLIGRVLDEPLSKTLRAVGWTIVTTDTASFAPERQILGMDPPGGSPLSISGTLTLTLSTGGRFDLKVKMPPVQMDAAKFPQEVYARGQRVSFNVRWLALARPQKNYKVFVHVWRPDGQLIQPDDREPRDNGQPAATSSWQAGRVVNDTYEFVIPADAPAGQYRIEAGMYDPSNGNLRLRVTDPGAVSLNPQHPDAVPVRVIEVR